MGNQIKRTDKVRWKLALERVEEFTMCRKIDAWLALLQNMVNEEILPGEAVPGDVRVLAVSVDMLWVISESREPE